jgi:hypothetical protein
VKLSDIVRIMGLNALTPELSVEEAPDVRRAVVSDVLSGVLSDAPEGGLLVTELVHMNVVAVAVRTGLAAVLFASGRAPDESVRLKAVEEGVRLYQSKESAFDVAGRLYALGLRGTVR